MFPSHGRKDSNHCKIICKLVLIDETNNIE